MATRVRDARPVICCSVNAWEETSGKRAGHARTLKQSHALQYKELVHEWLKHEEVVAYLRMEPSQQHKGCAARLWRTLEDFGGLWRTLEGLDGALTAW